MNFVAYYRVSTKRQGDSGLGLDAQKKLVADYVAVNNGTIVAEYTELESGKNDDRPELIAAIRHADLVGGRLIAGKLDRISRSLHFLLTLQKNKVDFVVADMPNLDSFTVSIYGALAQRERELISSRTAQALRAAKERGIKLGTPENLNADAAAKGRVLGVAARQDKAALFASKVAPIIQGLQERGMSLNQIAKELTARGIKTSRGSSDWTAKAVSRILDNQR